MWADVKKRAKARATELIVYRNRTGNFPEGHVVDILDRKVLSLIGRAAVEGLPGSKDSMPESEARMIIKSLRMRNWKNQIHFSIRMGISAWGSLRQDSEWREIQLYTAPLLLVPDASKF